MYSVNIYDLCVMYSYKMTWRQTLGCSEQNEPVCLLWREFTVEHLKALRTPFYAHQNNDPFLWIALRKPNCNIVYFKRDMLAIEQAFKWCPPDPDGDL
jgi:hypothetical protein